MRLSGHFQASRTTKMVVLGSRKFFKKFLDKNFKFLRLSGLISTQTDHFVPRKKFVLSSQIFFFHSRPMLNYSHSKGQNTIREWSPYTHTQYFGFSSYPKKNKERFCSALVRLDDTLSVRRTENTDRDPQGLPYWRHRIVVVTSRTRGFYR